MSIKRHILVAATPMLALGLLAAGTVTPGAAKEIIKIGSPTIKESNHEWMKVFKKRIEKRSKDRFQVNVYPLSQLGSIPRMIEGVQLGTIEMAIVPPSFLVGVDKRFGVMSAPGIFDDLNHGYRTVQDPEFKKAYWTLGEKKGIKIAGVICSADTNYASKKPIRRLADFKGKKIRVFASPMELVATRRLGASPSPMPLTEVLPGIQRGVIDGAKSGMVIFVAFKFATTAKYVLRTNESLICTVEMASKLWLNRLSKADRKMVLEESQANDDQIQEYAVKFNANIYNVWKKQGGELNTLPADEHAKMMRMLSTVGDEVVTKDPSLKDIYEMVKRVAARHKK